MFLHLSRPNRIIQNGIGFSDTRLGCQLITGYCRPEVRTRYFKTGPACSARGRGDAVCAGLSGSAQKTALRCADHHHGRRCVDVDRQCAGRCRDRARRHLIADFRPGAGDRLHGLFATMIMHLMTRFPWLSYAGLIFLVFLSMEMLYDGWPQVARMINFPGAQLL